MQRLERLERLERLDSWQSPLINTRVARLLGLMVIALLSGCSTSSSSLSPFTSDGCSLFPDASLISKADWCSCCYAHDIAYWQGGSEAQRLAADEALRSCVQEKTDNQTLANLMYEGVRLGGSPYFYNWYRWGYGWRYGRLYQPLTTNELRLVEMSLAQVGPDTLQSTCARE